MHPEARRAVSNLHTIVRLERWINCAKAELASSPHNELLHEFIQLNVRLLADERRKLVPQAMDG